MKKHKAELKSCPFCGGDPVVVEIEPHSHKGGIADFMPDHPGSAYIDCACGVGLIDATPESVVARWNNRVSVVKERQRTPFVIEEDYCGQCGGPCLRRPRHGEAWA